MTLRRRFLLAFLLALLGSSAGAAHAQRPPAPAPVRRVVASDSTTGSTTERLLNRVAQVEAASHRLALRVDSLQQANAALQAQLAQAQGVLTAHGNQLTSAESQITQLRVTSAQYLNHTHNFPPVHLMGPGLWPQDARPSVNGGYFAVFSSNEPIRLSRPVQAPPSP